MQTRSAWLAGCTAVALTPGVIRIATAEAQTGAQIKVAAGQISAHAEAYFAQDQGFFRDHGLDTAITTFRSGAAGAAAVAGHDVNIGVSNVMQLAQAHARNVPFVVFAAGGIHDSRFPISGLLVATASPIVSAKELNGKVVGVATLGGLDQLAARALIDRAGGDSSTVKFVEIPPSATVDALLAGRIAATNVEDPERSTALRAGVARSLGDGEDAIGKRYVQTAWYATTDWLDANKDTARRFAAAIYQAGAWAMASPEKAAAVMQKVLGIPSPPSAQRYATALAVTEFQIVLDVAARYNVIPPTNAASFVWNGQ